MINFKGNITYQVIYSKKVKKDIRTVTIADLHNYTDNKKRAYSLAYTISNLKPDIILIAGDIFNHGKYWKNKNKYNSFKYFLNLISDKFPICITLGNHDLYGNNNILNYFYDLKEKNIYSLYNDSIIIDGVEVIGYVPRFDLVSGFGLKAQIHGYAHDQFIKDYDDYGVKFNSKGFKIFLGHAPHLITSSENDIGLGKLSVCEFFVAGHLHDGYKPFFKLFNKIKKVITGKELSIFDYDRGLVEQPKGIVDKDGNYIKKSKKILGKTNLCRGIVYFDNDSNQKIWQSSFNIFYVNKSDIKNNQEWKIINEKDARKIIISNDLHSMLISEGVAPTFILKEKNCTINVVDIKKYK